MKLGKYSFTGPIESIDKIKDRSGVFAIVCKVDTEYFLIDVVESSKLRTKIGDQGKKDCWIKSCKGKLLIFVHYTTFSTQQKRIQVEQELRELFQPPCKTEKIALTDHLSTLQNSL
jgi:hypothetical protein